MNGPFPYDMLTDEQYKTYLKRIHPQSESSIDEKYEACIALGRFMNPKAVEHIAAALKHENGLPPSRQLEREIKDQPGGTIPSTKSSLVYALVKCAQPQHIPLLIEFIELDQIDGDTTFLRLLDGLKACFWRAWMQNDDSSAKRVAVYLSNLATNGSHRFRHSARRTLLDVALDMDMKGSDLIEEEIHHVISILKGIPYSSDTTAQTYAVRFSNVLQKD